jgi:hypothetical protein
MSSKLGTVGVVGDPRNGTWYSRDRQHERRHSLTLVAGPREYAKS